MSKKIVYSNKKLELAHNFFAEKGFVVFDSLLSDDALKSSENIIRKEIKGSNTVVNMHARDEWFAEFVARKEFTDVAKSLLGVKKVKVFTSMILNKPPKGLMTVPWHQDAAYDWPIDPVDCASLWLAFDDITIENGAMEVAVGAHKSGAFPRGNKEELKKGDSHFSDQLEDSIHDDTLKGYEKMHLTMPKGYASFHHSMIPHRSNPNITDKGRCAFIVRYCGENTKLVKYPGMKRENDFKDIDFLECK